MFGVLFVIGWLAAAVLFLLYSIARRQLKTSADVRLMAMKSRKWWMAEASRIAKDFNNSEDDRDALRKSRNFWRGRAIALRQGAHQEVRASADRSRAVYGRITKPSPLSVEQRTWIPTAPARQSTSCGWCKDGYLLMVNKGTGERLHDLPEPAGMLACTHNE